MGALDKSIGLLFVIVVCSILMIYAAPTKEENRNHTRQHRNFGNFFQQRKQCDCVCGLSNRQQRVVGGDISKMHEFPWLVGLSKDGEFYCGATLITQRHLLTAAHCVEGFNMKHITAVFGDHDRQSPERFSRIKARGIQDVKKHQQFDFATYNNDIAILELDEPIEFDATVQPACLPLSDDLEDFTGKLAVVAGWGKTGEKQQPSTILLKAPVPIWSKEECYNSGYGEYKISENMFCAGYPKGEKDACQGDSGGPLQVSTHTGNMEVVGVVSWGRGCARPNLPGIYTKIANYLDWVNEVLDGECLCSPPTSNPRKAG